MIWRGIEQNKNFKKWRNRDMIRFDSRHSRVGFTLIELLIVVAIIGILAAIAIPNFLQAQVRAKVARTQSDHNSYALALETYRVDNSAYMPSCGAGPGDEGSRYCANYWINWCKSLQIPLQIRYNRLTTPVDYMASLPTDPFGAKLFATDVQYYLYYDSCEVDLWIRSGRFDETAGWTDFPRVGQWMMQGAGPDSMFEQQLIFGTGGPYLRAYDPTNGTVSRGDIFRFGP